MAVRVDYLAKETVNNFLRNASLTLGTILTVAIALTMIGLALASNQGVSNLSERYEEEVEFIIWLKDPVTNRADCESEDTELRDRCETQDTQYQNTITRIRNDLRTSDQVQDSEFINKERTFLEFQEYFADSPEILSLVTVEAMPESFKVVPASTDSGLIEDFRERYEDEPGVREVSAAEDLLEDVQRFQSISGWLMQLAAAVAIAASTLLMYNSIRTAVFSRRREIEVMSLVGATKWFVRIPFMLEALLQGVLGAVASVVFLVAANVWLIPQIESIGPSYQGLQLGTGELVAISLLLIVAGALMGAIAAGVAVSKYLDA